MNWQIWRDEEEAETEKNVDASSHKFISSDSAAIRTSAPVVSVLHILQLKRDDEEKYDGDDTKDDENTNCMNSQSFR